MDSNLYIERVNRHLERKHTRRLENKENKICNSREIFSGVQKKVQKKWWWVSKNSRTEEDRVELKDHKRVLL